MASTRIAHPSFTRAGYEVHRQLVPQQLTTAAVRLLNLEIVRRGLTAEAIADGVHGTFFPHLRWDTEVLAIQQQLDQVVNRTEDEQWADPQLLLRFPDERTDGQPWPHLDEPPPWADGRNYRVIAGVALSPSRVNDGCLRVWTNSHVTEPTRHAPVELDPGDVVLMHPNLWHASTANRGPWIRYAAYFRLLAASPVSASAAHRHSPTHIEEGGSR